MGKTMNDSKKKSNYGLAILLGLVALVLSLIGSAIATFGSEDVGGMCVLASYILTVVTYIVCGGFRKTARYSRFSFMSFGASLGDGAKENIANEMKEKGYTYVYKHDIAMLMGPVAKFFLFVIWISCLINFPLVIALTAKSAARYLD